VRKRSGRSFANTRNSRALIIWHLTTCAGLAHGCVIPQEGNLNKSSFCSATGLWKLQNDTWVRGRDWCRQSTITSGSNHQATCERLFGRIRSGTAVWTTLKRRTGISECPTLVRAGRWRTFQHASRTTLEAIKCWAGEPENG
jgi:hypothetical protein